MFCKKSRVPCSFRGYSRKHKVSSAYECGGVGLLLNMGQPGEEP